MPRRHRLLKLQTEATFIAEFPAADAISGIAQFAKLVGETRPLPKGCGPTISQRLIRMLCKECRLAYRPNPKMLAKIGLPPETKTLYRAPSAPQ